MLDPLQSFRKRHYSKFIRDTVVQDTSQQITTASQEVCLVQIPLAKKSPSIHQAPVQFFELTRVLPIRVTTFMNPHSPELFQKSII